MEGVIASLTHIPPSKPGSAHYKVLACPLPSAFAVLPSPGQSLAQSEHDPVFKPQQRCQGVIDASFCAILHYRPLLPSGVVAGEAKVRDLLHCRMPAQIYNLGNTNPHTVSELVELLEKCLDRKAKRFYRPVPPTGDVLSTYADITAAKQVSRFPAQGSRAATLSLISLELWRRQSCVTAVGRARIAEQGLLSVQLPIPRQRARPCATPHLDGFRTGLLPVHCLYVL